VFTLTPVHVGTLTVDRSTLTYMRGFGERTRVPIIMWIIRGPGQTIVVDAGAPPPAITTRDHQPMDQTPDQDPPRALRARGVDPSSVRTVILTHLHFDHAANLDMFPHAEFVIQRRELDYARDPLPIHARGYRHPMAGFGERDLDSYRWSVIDGDAEVAPGLSLLLTPGHTPGLQSVVVRTERGLLVVASDNIPLEENWRGEGPHLPHLPSGVHVDLRECEESFRRLEETGGIVLPSHDFAVFASAGP
jgi:N-acyl homoserine lactone hydrolase